MNPLRRLGLMLLALLGFLAAAGAISALVNPYRAWPTRGVDARYLRDAPDSLRVLLPYWVRHEQPTTLLLGSSRVFVGLRIQETTRDGILNAAMQGGTLDELSGLLEVALTNPRLRRVIWGLDFAAFAAHNGGLPDPLFAARLDADLGVRLRETFFNLAVLQESSAALVRVIRQHPWVVPERQTPLPWPEEVVRARLNAEGPWPAVPDAQLDAHIDLWLDFYERYRPAPQAFQKFTALVEELRTRGVTLIVFAPLMSAYELEAIRQSGHWTTFQQWKRTLAAVTPFRDLSGYHPLATRDALFEPVYFCHFVPSVGHALLRHLMGHPCADCGELAAQIFATAVPVDAASVDQHLAGQNAALAEWLQKPSAHRDRVASVRNR